MKRPDEVVALPSFETRSDQRLIWTKLHIPPLRSKLVYRKSLIDRLSAGRDRPVVTVCSLAGSGKTSLICQWIQETKLPTAWYSVDETDNESDLFYRYLLTTLSGLDDRLSSALRPMLHARSRLSDDQVFPSLIAACLELPEDIYLVLDDYHLVTSTRIHDAVSYFLNHAPPKIHVVMVSRYAIPFPMSRLRVRNLVTEISAQDLKFTREETERYFVECFPVQLSEEQALELNEHLEGWVGGMQLFGLSLNGKMAVDGLNDMRARVRQESMEYLIDEVISAQSERVRHFLARTALLDRFNPELCREVTGQEDSTAILECVYKNNLLLVPLDRERTWYRYHHLLSETIREHVRGSSPDLFGRVHRTAALWFARRGYLEDAFRHAFASGDHEFAADMLEDYLTVLYDRYEVASFRRWLAKLPRKVFMQRALLRLLQCRFKIESVQLSEAKTILEDIEDHRKEAFGRYEEGKKRLCEDYLLLFKCILPYWLDPVSVNVEELKQISIQVSPENKTFRGIIKVVIGSSYLFRGEVLMAAETGMEATSVVFSSESLVVRMIWYRMMSAAERWQGHLYRSEAILKEAFLLLDSLEPNDVPPKFLLHLVMAWILYFSNNVERAFIYVTDALKYLDQAEFVWEIVEGNYLLALIHMAKGEPERAAQCIPRIQSAGRASGDPYVTALADVFCARLYVTQGDLKRAERWSGQRKLQLDEPFSFRFVHECLAHAELSYAEGRYSETGHILETLRHRCTGNNMMELVLEIDLLHCAALCKLNEYERAGFILEHALFFSETEGYIRPVIDYAGRIFPALIHIARALPREDRTAWYVKRILEASGIGTNNHVPRNLRGSGGRNLTSREREILQLLSLDLKYKEIAERTFVSLNTVRTHMKHIFEKLGVKTKADAVEHAESLGILGSGR